MANGKKAAVLGAARQFYRQAVSPAKAVFFFAAVQVAPTAAFLPAAGSVYQPTVFVEKTVGGQQTSIVISGRGLPEMRGITFTCAYYVPHASIMDAIVSSPQPATAISVFVDTAASSLSISIHAASTVLLPDNGRIAVFKISNPSTGSAWPLKVVKAVMIDNQGAGIAVTVSTNTSVMSFGGRAGGYGAAADVAAARPCRAELFEMNGRKISGSGRRFAPGCYLHNISRSNMTTAVSIR